MHTEGAHPKSIGYKKLFGKWRLLPAAGELAIRRVKWLQVIVAEPAAFRQLRAAVWGHLAAESPTILSSGLLADGANPFAKQFAKDLWLYFGLSPFDEFFRMLGVLRLFLEGSAFRN